MPFFGDTVEFRFYIFFCHRENIDKIEAYIKIKTLIFENIHCLKGGTKIFYVGTYID